MTAPTQQSPLTVDVERGLLLINGAIPGSKGSIVLVRTAVKGKVSA